MKKIIVWFFFFLLLVLIKPGNSEKQLAHNSGSSIISSPGMAMAEVIPVKNSEEITDKIDEVIVEKSKRRLHLKSNSKVIKSYSVSLGANPAGAKQVQGDSKTPEGQYIIDWRNSKSAYHLSLHISYPKIWQKGWARLNGVNPGGDIMIHGLPNGQGDWGQAHLLRDWTDGCIALTNEEIEEIWKVVPNGTPIKILP